MLGRVFKMRHVAVPRPLQRGTAVGHEWFEQFEHPPIVPIAAPEAGALPIPIASFRLIPIRNSLRLSAFSASQRLFRANEWDSG